MHEILDMMIQRHSDDFGIVSYDVYIAVYLSLPQIKGEKRDAI